MARRKVKAVGGGRAKIKTGRTLMQQLGDQLHTNLRDRKTPPGFDASVNAIINNPRASTAARLTAVRQVLQFTKNRKAARKRAVSMGRLALKSRRARRKR